MNEQALITCGLLLIGVLFILPIVLSIWSLVRSGRVLEELDQIKERQKKLTHMMAEVRNAPAPPAPAPKPAVAPIVAPPVPLSPMTPETAPVQAKIPDRPVLHPSPVPVPLITRLVELRREEPPAAPPPSPVPVQPSEPPQSLEVYVGQKVLPWLGVTVLVVGIAFFLWYAYKEMGPQGRLILAAAIGTVMVASGALLGRKEKYALLAGCLVAGGWAILYGTAYAMHYVRESRIIESGIAGFLILLVTGIAAVAHAMRHNREWIVAMAYGLIILTLFQAPEQGLAAWTAMAVSAAGLVVLAWRRNWIRLCTIGAAALYGAEIFWLKDASPHQVVPMAALLVGLWIVFQFPDFFHRPADHEEQAWHGALVLINFAGVLVAGYLIHLWMHIPATGAVRLILGSLYAVKALAGRRHEWKPAWNADLAFGLILLAAGAHEKFHGIWPSMAWLGLATLAFAYGVIIRDAYPRILGSVALVAAMIRVWTVDRVVKGTVPIGAVDVEKILLPALVGAGLFYAFVAIAAKLRGTAAKLDAESAILLPMLHVGGAALGLAIWYFPPPIHVALLFAIASLLLIEIGRWKYVPALALQGMIASVVAAFFVASVNLMAADTVLGISKRLAATIPVLAVWGYLRETVEVAGGRTESMRRFYASLAFAGLLALLRFEIGASGTPAAWALASVAWMAWGLAGGRGVEFGLGAIGSALSALMLASTRNPVLPLVHTPGALATGGTVIALFLCFHMAARLAAPVGSERAYRGLRDLLGVSMAASAFILIAQTCSGTLLTGSWALLGLALAGYGFALRDRASRWLGLIVLGVCLLKVGIFDLATFEIKVKIATLMVLGLVMIALSFVYVRFNRVVKDFLTRGE